MIDIRGLSVRKGGKSICCVNELDVQAEQRLVILGGNGAGKSTLLRVIAGLERQFDGDCHVVAGRRERCYVHQSPCMFRGTVLANTTYGLRVRGVQRKAAEQQAKQMLDRLGIQSLDQPATSLSGGEQRRVAIARAAVLSPKLLLLDEPFADLDEQGIQLVKDELDRMLTTLLIATPRPIEIPEADEFRISRVE